MRKGPFPLILHVSASGFSGPNYSALPDVIKINGDTSDFLYWYMCAGFAVAQITVTYPGLVGAVGTGKFIQPVSSALASFQSKDGGDRDVCLALQYLHRNAGSLDIDETRTIVRGRSQGGIHAQFAGLSIDRVNTTGFWATGSTRPSLGFIARAAASWWPAYKQAAGIIPDIYFHNASDTDWDGSPAVNGLSSVSNASKTHASALRYCCDDASYSGVSALNAGVNAYLVGTGTVVNNTFNNDNSNGAYSTVGLPSDAYTDIHAPEHSLLLAQQLAEMGANVRAVVGPETYASGGRAISTPVHIVGSDAGLMVDEFKWAFELARPHN